MCSTATSSRTACSPSPALRCRARGRPRCSARTPTYPAAVRNIMVTENRQSFLISKGGSYRGELDIYNTSESRNEFDTRAVPCRLRLDHGREVGHARRRANRRNGEADRHLRRAAGRSDGARRGRRRGLLGPPRHERRRYCPTSSPTRTAARARSSATCSATTRRRRSSPRCPRSRTRRRRRSTASCRCCRRSASTTRSASACRSTSWVTGRSRRLRPTTSRRRSGGIASSSRTSRSCSCAASSPMAGAPGPLSLATGLTYREQSFHDGAYPVEIDELGPPFNAARPRHSRHPLDVLHGQPEPASVLHRIGHLGRLRRLGGIRRDQRADLAMGVGGQRLGMSFAYRSSDYSSVGRFDSWKVGSTSRCSAICASAPRSRATCAKRRSPSGSTTRRRAGACSIRPATACNRPSRSRRVGNPNLVPEVGRHHGLRARLSAELGGGAAHVGGPLRHRHLRLDRDARARSASSTSATRAACSASTCFATISAC